MSTTPQSPAPEATVDDQSSTAATEAIDPSAPTTSEAPEATTTPVATESAEGDTKAQSVTQVTDGGAEAPATPRRSTAHEDLVREGEIAADFLESLLDIADLDGDLEVDVEGDRAAVAIVDSEDGAAPRRLVGPGGAVLEALQELTRLAVQAETGERSRLMLDVASYRSDRRTALIAQARTAIAAVKESGEREELEPMSAFERKVVHDEVLAAGLHSESEGVEPSRFVVILPAG